jgi:2-dehydropantoate 2-reductase
LSYPGCAAIFRNHLLLLSIGYKYRKLKSSSLQSIERGKITEIEYLNGYIVKNGKMTGSFVPVNEYIVEMIHDIEQNRRKTGLHNFDDPFFDRFN